MTLQRLMAPTITATLSTGLVLDVKAASITLDESRAPYVQAQLTCAAPDGVTAETIDPRKSRRVVIVLDDHASTFGKPSETRTFDLVLHDREKGAASGELQLTCYSDESLLIDRVLLLNNVKDWAKGTAQSLTRAVLEYLGFTLAAGQADMNIAAASAVQSPGQSFWDFLDGTLQGGNLRLWCDEGRTWHLDDKATIAAGLLSLSYAGTVTGLNDAIGLDDLWADSLVVRYSYLTDAGNAETAYEASGDLTSVRGARVDFASRPAVSGAARRLLRRLQGRGRVLTHEAVSRFAVTPTQSFIATLPDDAPVQTGLVSAVTWNVPSDRMTVRTRELTDTTTTAWAAQPAGRTWASVASGVSWNRVDAVPWSAVVAGKSWASVPAGWRWSEMKGYTYG